MGCNQSTISRHASKCQQVFHVRLRRQAAEWVVCGDTELLSAERRLHQSYRWELELPLRFEAQHWMRDFYAGWQLDGWVKGNQNYLEYERPLDLLRNHIIDAWLCGAPDIPEDPDLICLPLFEMPMLLVARRDHPLLMRPGALAIEDAAAYPLLPLPELAFPVFQGQLAALGLTGACGEDRSDPAGSEADGLPYADRCLGVASALTLPLYGPDYQALPLKIPIRFGDVLVMRAEFAAHRRAEQLLASLLTHIRAATEDCRAVRVLEPHVLSHLRPPMRMP